MTVLSNSNMRNTFTLDAVSDFYEIKLDKERFVLCWNTFLSFVTVPFGKKSAFSGTFAINVKVLQFIVVLYFTINQRLK